MASEFNKQMDAYLKQKRIKEKARNKLRKKTGNDLHDKALSERKGFSFSGWIKGFFTPEVKVYTEEEAVIVEQEPDPDPEPSEFDEEEKEIEHKDTRTFFQRIKELFTKTRFTVIEEEYDTEPEDLSGEEDISKEETVESEGKPVRKKGFFKRMFGSTQAYDEQVELEEYGFTKEDLERFKDIESEIKELGRISLVILKKINPKELRKFRDSKDFERYKEILKKYSLIREKKDS